MSLILHTAHPQMPIDPNRFQVEFPFDLSLIDVLCAKSASVLTAMPVVTYDLPPSIASQVSMLPDAVASQLADVSQVGVQLTQFHVTLDQTLNAAMAHATKQDWKGALENYRSALDATPDTEIELRGALLQDMAVLMAKAGDRQTAAELAQKSVETLANSTQLDARVSALDTATGILQRAGNTDMATRLAAEATQIRNTNNLNPVIVQRQSIPGLQSTRARRGSAASSTTRARSRCARSTATGTTSAPDGTTRAG
jgi:hypothetical protein